MLPRHRLFALLALTAILSTTCFAQTSPTASPAAGQSSTRPARPAPQPMQVSVEMEKVLKAWEDRSARFKRLQGEHERFVYQPTVGLEMRASGQFFFEAPDKGRIDIEPVKITAQSNGVTEDENGVLVGQRSGLDGKPLRVKSSEPETWVADGKQVLGLNETLGEKLYSRVEIPPQMQGENIVDGPLPFLFGISAEKMKARYHLQFGPLHNLDQSKGNVSIHVIAKPTRPQDAQNWQRAEILLEPRYFLPKAIRLKDGLGPGATETVYVFNLTPDKIFANQQWKATGMRRFLPGFDPFKPDLRGFKLLENHRVSRVGATAPGQ